MCRSSARETTMTNLEALRRDIDKAKTSPAVLRTRLALVEARAIAATPCTKKWRDATREASDLRAAIRAAEEA
jgi:hypothetical protein